MERRTSGSSRAGVGNSGRITSITHPDRTVMEPSGSRLERTSGTGCLDTGGSLIQRLGCTFARAGGATADSRTRLECTRCRCLGCPEDRGTGGSTGAFVVRPFRTALRAGSRRATVELAPAGGSRACSVVIPG